MRESSHSFIDTQSREIHDLDSRGPRGCSVPSGTTIRPELCIIHVATYGHWLKKQNTYIQTNGKNKHIIEM